MKKNTRILSLTLLFVLLFASVVSAAGVGLKVDGVTKEVSLDNIQGRTLIPAEFLKNMGFTVSKYGSTATIKKNEITFEFTLGTNEVKVNDIDLKLDTKSYEKNGEIYLPVRFVFETLGYDLEWDGVNNRVLAKTGSKITYPVEIEDNGKSYTINQEPNTIVSLAPSVTEILFALGVGDKVKGRTQYCNYPNEVSDVEVVGNMTDPSIEAIVNIYPDMIIASTHYKAEVLSKFEEAEIEVITKASPQTIGDMYDFILRLGAVVDRNYEARALVSAMKSKVGTVQMKLSNVNEKPQAYYVVGTGQWGEYTAGRDTFISEIIAIAGGKNVADDVTGWSYSIERLIDNDPEIIFGGEYNINSMKDGESYKILSAVQNGNCIVVNENIFSRPSPRLIFEGLDILLEMFHKDIAKELQY